jgi:hypothetical protein
MDAVMRKITQATGGISNVLVGMEKQAYQRRHTFGILGVKGVQGRITLAIEPAGDSLDVAVKNDLPHRLPTGDFGFRVVTLEVFGMDAGGRSIPVGSWELAGESSTAISPRETRVWHLRLDKDFKMVRAVLTRRSYDQDTLVLAQTQAEVAQP